MQGYGQFGYVFGISLLNQANGIIQADVSGQTLFLDYCVYPHQQRPDARHE